MEASEVGRRLCDLASGGVGLRIYRGDAMIGFWEGDDATLLREGDLVVEIVPTTLNET